MSMHFQGTQPQQRGSVSNQANPGPRPVNRPGMRPNQGPGRGDLGPQPQGSAPQGPGRSTFSFLWEDLRNITKGFFSARPLRAFENRTKIGTYLILALVNILLYGIVQASLSYNYITSDAIVAKAKEQSLILPKPTFGQVAATFGVNSLAQIINFVVIILLCFIFTQIVSKKPEVPFFGIYLIGIASFPYTLLLVLIGLLGIFIPGFAIQMLVIPHMVFLLTLYLAFKYLHDSRNIGSADAYWLFILLFTASRIVLYYFPSLFQQMPGGN